MLLGELTVGEMRVRRNTTPYRIPPEDKSWSGGVRWSGVVFRCTGEMVVCEMPLGELTVGVMTFAELISEVTVGDMPLGEKTVGKMIFGEMPG